MNSPGEIKPATANNPIDDTLTILLRLPIFKDISLEMVKLYAYLAKREEYKKGDVILRQGRGADRLCLIITGEVLITHPMVDREIVLQELSADSMHYFGELALICECDWNFNAHAGSDVSLLSISRESFMKVIERYPENFVHAVSKIIKLRLQRFDNQMSSLIDQMDEDTLNRLTMPPFTGN